MFFRRKSRKTTNKLDYMSNLSALISAEVYKPIAQRKYNILDYTLDREIENDFICVYVNHNNKDVIMGIRGTKTGSDLYSDFLLGLQQITNLNAFINSDRFKTVKSKLEQVITKYDKNNYNIRITGHSLAGFETIKLAQKYNNIVDGGVAFNAGSVPIRIFKDDIPNTVEHYRNPRDIISYGWKDDKQTTEYINKDKMSLWNPLKNHTINYFT